MSAANADVERARRLVLAHGWNATAYQILNPGIELWFDAAGDAVIGYVRYRRTRVVAGAPICAPERLAAVAAAFEAEAAGFREAVCYFAAEERLASIVGRARPYAALCLGAQPTWRPQQLLAVLHTRSSLRAQLHRARNKGVAVTEWPRERAAGDGDLRRCLAEWFATRGLPALHFLVESPTLDALLDRRLFVAERAGRAVAFLVATPIPARSGWLIEQIVRGDDACNGTSEMLLVAAAQRARDSGVELLTLGLAPLSQRAAPAAPGPPWHVRALLAWLRAHGRRFYNFRGLESWKAKFQPERWEPVFALATTPRVRLRTLHAIAGAFARGSPVWLAVRGVGRAIASEWRRLRGRA